VFTYLVYLFVYFKMTYLSMIFSTSELVVLGIGKALKKSVLYEMTYLYEFMIYL